MARARAARWNKILLNCVINTDIKCLLWQTIVPDKIHSSGSGSGSGFTASQLKLRYCKQIPLTIRMWEGPQSQDAQYQVSRDKICIIPGIKISCWLWPVSSQAGDTIRNVIIINPETGGDIHLSHHHQCINHNINIVKYETLSWNKTK